MTLALQTVRADTWQTQDRRVKIWQLPNGRYLASVDDNLIMGNGNFGSFGGKQFHTKENASREAARRLKE